MRDYTLDMEDKLEKVYQTFGGNGLKKFGLENMSN